MSNKSILTLAAMWMFPVGLACDRFRSGCNRRGGPRPELSGSFERSFAHVGTVRANASVPVRSGLR